MEALFAEMRRAQAGGRDFAADAAAEQEAREAQEAAEARAALASSDDSERSDEASDEDDGVGERRSSSSAGSSLPPRGLSDAEEARLLRASEAGRSADVAARQRRTHAMHDALFRDGLSGEDGGGPWPATEAARHRAVASLASRFEATCGHVLGGRWWSHYESWLYSRRAAGRKAGRKPPGSGGGGGGGPHDDDPVIPSPEAAKEDRELIRKLKAAGLSEYEAKGACATLSRATAKAAAQAAHEGAGGAAGRHQHVKLNTFEVGGKGKYDGAAREGGATKAQLTCGKVKMEINAGHLAKLRALYGRYGAAGKRRDDDERRFRASVFCLLARYSALQGAHYKAGAMQAALPSRCFDALKEAFDVSMELCASPLNCHFRRYCSAFLDTDGPFGSMGDCFQFEPSEGSFEANPPFDPAFISRLVGHLEGLLSRTKRPLSFVVVVPHWPEKPAWQKLANSAYARRAIKLDAGKHGFVAGGQHLRPDRVTPSAAATSLFFLQNDAGAQRWPVTKDRLSAVRRGFRGDDAEDDDGRVGSDDGGSDDDVDDDVDDADASDARRMEAARVKRAARGRSALAWNPDAVLFFGVGSGKRWGSAPAEWVVEAAGEAVEDHWVGEDPEDEADEDPPETDDEEDEDEEEETGNESEDESVSEESDEDADEDSEAAVDDTSDPEGSDDEFEFEFDPESESEEAPPAAAKRRNGAPTSRHDGGKPKKSKR